jgi:hypothetical protein
MFIIGKVVFTLKIENPVYFYHRDLCEKIRFSTRKALFLRTRAFLAAFEAGIEGEK